MSHLSRDERLLALDGALEAARQAHVASCPACRADVEGLGTVLARVRAVDVPEPSPLFWDHLAARVGDAIAREPAPSMAGGWWAPRLTWAAVAVLVAAAGFGYMVRSTGPSRTAVAETMRSVTEEIPAQGATASDDGVAGHLDAAFSDDGWALLTAVAEDAEPDETFLPAAGQAELSLSLLSAEERAAVAGELAAALAPGRPREG
jgi:hypothetical protein